MQDHVKQQEDQLRHQEEKIKQQEDPQRHQAVIKNYIVPYNAQMHVAMQVTNNNTKLP
jgi:hypothetical protein